MSNIAARAFKMRLKKGSDFKTKPRVHTVFHKFSIFPGRDRALLYVLFFLICLSTFSSFSFPSGDAPVSSSNGIGEEKLNLLLISIDTLRTDRLSCYNTDRLETPNIDSLAEKGTVFARAFAHASTTLASHTSMLLGTTPLYHGVHDNLNFKVREEHLTLAELLKRHGYATSAFLGAFPLDARFGLSQGFDSYDDGDFWSKSKGDEVSAERRAGVVVDRAMEWLNGRSTPWFMWVHFFDPHHPYEPPEPYRTQYKDAPYDGEVAYVDHELGRLFVYLKKLRLEEKTIIVFTADHGESLGEHGEETHGCFAYNSTIWIPLIIYMPGSKPRVVRQDVSHIDIFPTVCDYLKLEKPAVLQGMSLLPCMEGKKLGERTIYFESLSPYYNFGWAPIRGIIQKEHKFIDSPIPELYDLEKDFDETQNLIQQNDMTGYQKSLRQNVQLLGSDESPRAEEKTDKDALEKLRSLGYIGSYPGERKQKFTAEDDAKILLPFHYKAEEALALKDQGRIGEGIELLKEVITEKKNVSKAYSNLAALYRSQGRLGDAIQVLRMGLEFLPDSYMIFSGYMGFLSEACRWDEMISVFEGLAFKQLEFDPYVWDLAGQAHLHLGDLEKALLLCERAVSIDENYAVSYVNQGSIHLKIFHSTSAPDTLSKATLNFEKALVLDPELSAAHDGLGLVDMIDGNFDEAIQHLETALRLEPDLYHVIYNLGLAHMKNGDKANALFYLSRFKNTPPYMTFSPIEKDKLERYIDECIDRQ